MNSSKKKRPLITVLIPVFNEEDNVPIAYSAINEVFSSLPYDLELLFNDNHSTDGTMRELERLAATDNRVKVVRFARNFGFQCSVLTGYRMASGDAVIQIDCDLQDPPSLIPEFLKLWEKGHDVVVGIRQQRHEVFLLSLGRRLFYKLVTAISDDNIMQNAGDFRLVDRSVVDHLAQIKEASPYTRGLISSLAANQTGVEFARDVRKFGKSKFPLFRLTGIATDGIVNHSLLPLKLAGYAGVIVFFGTLMLLFYYLAAWLFGGQQWPAGFATTTILILISLGLNAMFIGVLGEYIGRIYSQVRYRPLTIIETTLNMNQKRARHE